MSRIIYRAGEDCATARTETDRCVIVFTVTVADDFGLRVRATVARKRDGHATQAGLSIWPESSQEVVIVTA